MNPKNKKEHPKEKLALHPRNKHRERYDFALLVKAYPALEKFVKLNEYKDVSIDFFNPDAVKALNKALLFCYYNLCSWDIPNSYLCPPIPGRADYVHYMADVLTENTNGVIPKGSQIKCLDIGVGANCVYPIIGNSDYGWSFVGSDVDPVSVASASKIAADNPNLRSNVAIRLQPNKNDILNGVIQKDEKFELVICNPPFHSSVAEAAESSVRKQSNLKQKRVVKSVLNFGGTNNELWCDGGEEFFVRTLIEQSINYKFSCLWFSSLISKQSSLDNAIYQLEKNGIEEYKIIGMSQGNKVSRVLVWTFQTKNERTIWMSKKSK